MKETNKDRIFYSISIILGLLFLFLIMNAKISSLSEQIDKLSRYNNNFDSSKLHDLYGYTKKIESDNRWINESSYKFLDLTDDNQRVITEINVSFNELYNSSKIYLVVTNSKDDNDFFKVELTKTNFLEYSQNVELDYKKTYSIDILSEGEILNKKSYLTFINTSLLSDTSRNNFNSFGIGHSEDTYTYRFSLRNNHYNIDEFRLNKIYMKIYKDSTLIEEKDLMNIMEVNSDNPDYTLYSYNGSIISNGDESILLELIVEDDLGSYTIKKYINE